VPIESKPAQYYGRQRPEMLPYVPTSARHILEVGCGAGQFSAQLRNSERELWGVEMDPEAADKAKQALDKVLCGDVDSLFADLPAHYFDCIIFNDVLEHLVDPFGLLRRLHTLLAPGGVVVASIPNVRYFFNLRELLMERQWRYRDYGIMDRTHLRFFTRYSIEDMFRDAGYAVRRIDGINGFKSWKFSMLNVLSLGHVADMRYEQFACVAEKAISSEAAV
jgi:2-polyprenyl-3-methyl-5-hydroxy-6-metoxy-1,4-benzoquinol methylase